MKKPTAFSLFAGIGGFDVAFTQAGYHMVGANEWDAAASITYMVNNCSNPCFIHYIDGEEDLKRLEKEVMKSAKFDKAGNITYIPMAGTGYISHHPELYGTRDFWFGDVRKLKGKDILDTLNMDPGEIDAVVGGPPCQGFSHARGRRDPGDYRNQLIFEFGRLIMELRPKSFLMENVPGITTMKDSDGELIIEKFYEQIGSDFKRTAKSAKMEEKFKVAIRQRTLDCFTSKVV